jgi:hypothetical protein
MLPAIHELRFIGPTPNPTEKSHPRRRGVPLANEAQPFAEDGTMAILYKISNPVVKSFLQTLSSPYFFAICGKSVYFQASR